MNIQDVMIGTGKFCLGAIVNSSMGACAGYALFHEINPLLAAKAFAIATLAAYIFRECVKHGYSDYTAAQRNFIVISGYTIGSLAFTAALSKLDLISTIGQDIFSFSIGFFISVSLCLHIKKIYLFAS